MSSTPEVVVDHVEGIGPDGRPDPADAAALGLVPAPLGRRALSFAIDAAAVALLAVPLAFAYPQLLATALRLAAGEQPDIVTADPRFGVAVVLWAVGQGLVTLLVLVQLLLHGIAGLTIGKAFTRLRSVNVRTFGRPGFFRVLLRAVVLWFAMGVIPILGAVPFLLSPLWDRARRGRGWLDAIGATWLIDIRAGLNPLDTKALRAARRRLTAPEVVSDAPLPSLSTSSSGAVTSFVPSGRSSSGVVLAVPAAGAPAWTPPMVGEASPASPAAPAESAAPAAPVAPAPAAPPAAPAASAGVLALLVFDDGLVVPITGDRVLGRNPQADGTSEPLVIADRSMQISKSHASVGVDGRGFWVMDRHSSNGTVVLAAAGPQQLQPGERHAVPWGASIELGGRRFRVDAPTPVEHA